MTSEANVKILDDTILDSSRIDAKNFKLDKGKSYSYNFEANKDTDTGGEKKKCKFNGVAIPTTYVDDSQEEADLYFGTRCCKK